MHRKQKQLWGWDNVITKELPQFARLRELPQGSTESFTSVSPEPTAAGAGSQSRLRKQEMDLTPLLIRSMKDQKGVVSGLAGREEVQADVLAFSMESG